MERFAVYFQEKAQIAAEPEPMEGLPERLLGLFQDLGDRCKSICIIPFGFHIWFVWLSSLPFYFTI